MDIIIQTATQVAMKSTMRKRYACVITHKGHVIGTGYNIEKGYSRRLPDDERHSYHAERNAILSIKNYRSILHQCKIYIIRMDKGGNVHSAMPCSLCHKFLKRNGVYGTYTIPETIRTNDVK
jgi:deoxycytidylate deaminase